MSVKEQRVCIIGAGTAGLCALKHALEQDMRAVCYEQCAQVGGTWVYEERVDTQNEDEVHSSMYEGLRTNLPKEVMGYPDFDYPADMQTSFISSSDVLNFLQAYEQHFKLTPHIKLQHEVIRVRPLNGGGWEVYIKDLKNNSYNKENFDFVMVCNGHYTTPLYPQIKDMNLYKGVKTHSHLYRKAERFKDATILVIGSGPSGMDIVHQLHKVASHVYLSHHLDPPPVTAFMSNVTQKPDIQRFTANGAIFQDDSTVQFTHVIFCTGYKCTFPFLSLDCGLHVDDNYVQPLYKHCININEPTMAIIGLPHKVCPSQLVDLQIRFALKYFSKPQELPSRTNMLQDTESEMQERWASGLTKPKAHEMGKRQFAYYKELADTAGITPMKPVVEKLMMSFSRQYLTKLATYRNKYFKVIDDENFEKFDLS